VGTFKQRVAVQSSTFSGDKKIGFMLIYLPPIPKSAFWINSIPEMRMLWNSLEKEILLFLVVLMLNILIIMIIPHKYRGL
jgi:hypothetical protein